MTRVLVPAPPIEADVTADQVTAYLIARGWMERDRTYNWVFLYPPAGDKIPVLLWVGNAPDELEPIAGKCKQHSNGIRDIALEWAEYQDVLREATGPSSITNTGEQHNVSDT